MRAICVLTSVTREYRHLYSGLVENELAGRRLPHTRLPFRVCLRPLVVQFQFNEPCVYFCNPAVPTEQRIGRGVYETVVAAELVYDDARVTCIDIDEGARAAYERRRADELSGQRTLEAYGGQS